MQLHVKSSEQTLREMAETGLQKPNRNTINQRRVIEDRNLCKSGDSSVTTRAVVAMEINLPKFSTSTATLPGMTSTREEENRLFFVASHHSADTRSFRSCVYFEKYRSSFHRLLLRQMRRS